MHFNLYVWEYFINFLETLLFYIFINTKLHNSNKFQHLTQIQFVFLFLQFIMVCTLNYFEISSLITVLLSGFTDILFALLFYSDVTIMRIFWGGMYSVVCMISEYITVFVPQTFSKVTSLDLLLGGKLHIPFSMLYIALITVFVFLFYCISNKDIFLTPLQKLSYVTISIAGIMIGHFNMLITLEAEENFHKTTFTSRLILVNLFFIVLFLALLIYIYQLGYSNEQNKKLLEDKRLHDLEKLEYENLIKTTASLREMKHDINIHLDMIQTLAKNNETEDLIAYIENYHHALEHTHHLISTGNTAIDCILSAKIHAAQKAGIQTDFSVMLPHQLPLDVLSLSSLLGNLWNNSLEANVRLLSQSSEKHAYIQFFIKPFHGMVIIHIENSYDGILHLAPDNSFLSLKTENEHGIGMKRIHNIVENANGIIQIQTQNYIFCVHILIPLEETTNENENYHSGRPKN